jgi:polyribonucleotide nucleotidyltransferase
MGVITLSTQFGTTPITLETGRVAKLASGAVLVTMGETVVLVTCVGARSSRPGQNFLPLTCDYIEKMYAAGRIPGGYFKREGRQGPWEILVSRLMDRPLRPLFPGYWRSDIQIIATVLSADNVNDPSVCAMVGASAAATLSDVPFDGPIGGCRVALIDGEYVVNPTFEQQDRADLSLVVAASKDAVVMVEGEAREVSETQMIDAIMAAHEAIKPVIALQEEMQRKAGRPKMKAEAPQTDADLFRRVIDLSLDRLADAVAIPQKEARYDAVAKVSKDVVATLVAEEPELATRTEEIKDYLKDIQKDIVRTQIIEEGVRIDGRGPKDIRRITCEVGVLPRTHGSALFTRGETQSLTTVTLGTRRTSSASTTCAATNSSATCCTTTSRRSPRARRSRCAAPAAARSVTATWRSAASSPRSRSSTTSATRCASSARSSSRTARRRWRRSARRRWP